MNPLEAKTFDIYVQEFEDRFKRLGPILIINFYCDALEEQEKKQGGSSGLHSFLSLMNYEKWCQILNLEDPCDILEETARDLEAIYREKVDECGFHPEDDTEMKIDFLRHYGSQIPPQVWARRWANDMIAEAREECKRGSMGPTTQIMMDMKSLFQENQPMLVSSTRVRGAVAYQVAKAEDERLSSLPSISCVTGEKMPDLEFLEMEQRQVGNQFSSSRSRTMRPDRGRRDVVEKKLLDLSFVGNEQAFIDSFCDALEKQEKPIVRDFEQLLCPEDWDNMRSVPEDDERNELSEGEESDMLNAMYRTAAELEALWHAKLAKVQREFLREHGARIPCHVLPKSLAYEAQCEESYHEDHKPTTNVLKTMGIEY